MVPKRFGLARVISLARALSKLGYCSRSRAAELILGNGVRVNGRVVRNPGFPVRIGNDRIEVDGAALEKTPFIYLAMNKPRGVVTTASDEKGRTTVYDVLERVSKTGSGKGTALAAEGMRANSRKLFLKHLVDDKEALPPQQRASQQLASHRWVAPVGRLDKASEGLLLFTNDSAWAATVTDPASHLDKVYHVQVDCVLRPDMFAKVVDGCVVDGEHLRAKGARLLRQGSRNSWLEIVLDEGKNRQIRRLLEALEVKVLRLVRVQIGPLELGDLKKGEVRALTAKEKQALDRALRRAE